MDDNLIVDLEGRANPGRKTTHGEMEGEGGSDENVMDSNPQILELRYLKARTNSYRPDMISPQETEAANLAQFRAMDPAQQLAMVKYLEHMCNYVKAGESFAYLVTKLAAKKGLVQDSAVEDQSLISEAGRLVSPIMSFLPTPIANAICVGAAVFGHLPPSLPNPAATALAAYAKTGNPEHLTPTPASAQTANYSVPAELVVDIEPQNGSTEETQSR